MSTMTFSTELTRIDCGECGGVYAILEKFRKKKREKGGFWNCPYCLCSWGFSKDRSEVQELRDEVDRKDRQLVSERASHDRTRADRDHVERCRRAEKAAKTRIKNRVGRGVCPCCNRSFENLARHMQAKHPEFAETS